MKLYHKDAPTSPRPKPFMRFLSLGAGTQSSAVALMVLDGTLPPIDAAIFADTQWEPAEVYKHLERLKDEFERANVPLITVTKGNIRNQTEGQIAPPMWMQHDDGRAVPVSRSCTQDYKVRPLHRKMRELVADKLGIHAPTWRQIPKDIYVEQVMGISVDEAIRAKQPQQPWAINDYPLISLGWRRHDTIAYLERSGWNAPRSACIGCPYRDARSWRQLTEDEFADAVAYEQSVHDRGKKLFLHRSLLPLAQVDLSTAEDHGQQSLFGNECEGMCGI